MMKAGAWYVAAALAILSTPGSAQVRPDTAEPWREFQWLYGSGEAAAISIQAYNGLRDYALARVEDRKAGRPLTQVILTGDFDRPSFAPCGDKPLAVVFDVDETLVLNLGAEYWAAAKDQTYEQSRAFDAHGWDEWERTGAHLVEAVPGAVDTVNALRAANIHVIFNSNRSEANAPQTAEAIKSAGLGTPKLDEDLFLDRTGKGLKDSRRATIAARWCVVAMAGDQLGDFSDFFNRKSAGEALSVRDRRKLVLDAVLHPLWGHGWFVLPNPVYGSGTHGTLKEVFPEKRWTPSQAHGGK